MSEEKKTIYSGMQPSGYPSLGNYLGALKNWNKLQDEYNCLFCVVDMHSITVRQEPAQLRKKSRDLLTLFIATGLNPEKNIIYYQSHVSAHAELAWILNCFTYMGELNRMTQFKEKSQKHSDNINAGLFSYPCLMASDILLYQTDLVPIGEDQVQHLELTRDLATRMNNIYGNIFNIPEAYVGKVGARIKGLQEPTKKMSKSQTDNDNNVIYMLDEPNVIANKIKRSVTDSDNTVKYSEEKPGISNLLNIYCTITGKTVEEAENEFEGKGYGYFKSAVADVVLSEITPIQEKYKKLSTDKTYIDSVIKNGAEKAEYIANKTLRKVQKKIGFPVK